MTHRKQSEAEDTPLGSFRVIIPTLNAGPKWIDTLSAVLNGVSAEDVLILDSSSTDATVDIAQQTGCAVCVRPRNEFNHGATRQLGIDMSAGYKFAVFLTQDAVLQGQDDIKELIASFLDPKVAAAYGRQLPVPGAGAIEAHARIFNYPPVSSVRTLVSREQLGFKSIFISNSFAAYRLSALHQVGGFPENVLFGEDTVTSAKLLLAGWKIAYVAEAKVYHSHSYNWMQEFRRYFDIGVLHSRESWLRDEFGGTGGEGKRFVLSEVRFLWPKQWWLLPSALIRTVLKLAGYRLGTVEKVLPTSLKRQWSMNKSYWK